MKQRRMVARDVVLESVVRPGEKGEGEARLVAKLTKLFDAIHSQSCREIM